MTPAEILAGTIRPVLGLLWTEHRVPNGPAAEAMLLAIGLQESRFIYRDQIVAGKQPGQVGPATGFWQFERAGGVRGVMRHASTAAIARAMVDASGLDWDEDAIWRAFTAPDGDQLACAFARLLLFADPRALPAATEVTESDAWDCYQRNWRPGKPKRDTWGGFWRQAVALAQEGAAPAPAPAPAPPGSLAALEARVAILERKLALIADAAG